MPARRLKKTQAHLEITAFINLIVVLVPFLLSVSVFTHLAVIDLSLPAQSNEQVQKLDPDKPLKLEVIIRAEPHRGRTTSTAGRCSIADPEPGDGRPRHSEALAALMQADQAEVPAARRRHACWSRTSIPYDTLVQVMDAVRAGHQVQGARVVSTDYFPNISIGDAPVIRQ